MERQVMASTNLLKYQLGLSRNSVIKLTDELYDLVTEIDFETVLQANMTLSENIDYQILSDQERLAYMDLKLKKAEYLPSLSAFYSMDFTAQRDEFNFLDSNKSWYRASMIGLSLSVPIFSGGIRKAGVSQKRLAYEQARNNRELGTQGLELEFIQAKFDFSNALEKYRIESRNLDLSQKVVTTTRKKYDEGLATSLELTQVNDQYLNTLSSYTSAMVEVLNAKIKMDILLNNI
jgi:outer membrane protein TolC